MSAKLAVVAAAAVAFGIYAMPASARDGTLSVGTYHACGVLSNHHLLCWGLNWNADTYADPTDPNGDVSGPNLSTGTYVEVSAGGYHTCALTTDGHIQCWGAAGPWTNGPNSSTDTFIQVSAGWFITCGLKTDRHLECWGSDDTGGNFSGPNASTDTFWSVYAGTCGLNTDNHIRCWGSDNYGQTSGANASTSTYNEVVAPSGAVCALKADNYLDCWGAADPVWSAVPFSDFDGGSGELCGIKLDGHLQCWGNDFWDVVSGPNSSTDTFVAIGGATDYDMCALTVDLHARCWGVWTSNATEAGVLIRDQSGNVATFLPQYTPPRDTTPPVLDAPDLTVNATTPTGTNVTFDVTATDPDDAAGPVTCTPSSGSFFPIGTTTVNCQSTDTHGNTGYASFTVTVLGAADQLASLQASLTGSFASQVQNAAASMAAGNTTAACNELNAFANHVSAQSGKQLTTAQANDVLADEARIEAVIGC